METIGKREFGERVNMNQCISIHENSTMKHINSKMQGGRERMVRMRTRGGESDESALCVL
jgi:hypothetical protein